MEIRSDFSELLELFNAHNVEYMIVGAFAVGFHGAPRYTGDIDLFIHPTPENAAHIIAALTEFGFGEIGIEESDFSRDDHVVQLGYEPMRVDIMTSVSGVGWEEANCEAVKGNYGTIPVRYIGRDHLIRSKQATGRSKDFGDIEALGENSNSRS